MNWISVKDRLPEQDGRYAVCYRFKDQPFLKIYIGDWMYGIGWANLLSDTQITHWMPLPEAPKER